MLAFAVFEECSNYGPQAASILTGSRCLPKLIQQMACEQHCVVLLIFYVLSILRIMMMFHNHRYTNTVCLPLVICLDIGTVMKKQVDVLTWVVSANYGMR